VLYHGLVLFLLFWLVVQLTDFRVAAISSVVIAVLAVHVEPVAWIMGRKDILYALFSLLSMHFYLRFRKQTHIRSKILLYCAIIVCSVAAYMSKISAVILPVLLVLIAICESIDSDASNKVRLTRKDFTRIALEITPVLLLALIAYIGYRYNQEQYGVLARAYTYSPSDYLKVAFLINPLVLTELPKLIVAPNNLSIFYNDPALNTLFTWHHYVKAISVFSLIGLAVWHMWRTNIKALLLLTCFFVILLPYGNWKYFGFSYADRYLYFAVLFLIPALVSYLHPYMYQTNRWGLKIGIITVFLITIYNNYTYRQQHLYVWQNGETLWRNAISSPNASLRAYNSLTEYYITRASYAKKSEKTVLLEKAKANNQTIFNMPIKQGDPRLLAISYHNEGLITHDLSEQLQAFNQALDILPTYSDAMQSIALCYFKLAQREVDANKKSLYAQKSLHYFRQHIENPSSLSYTRSHSLEMLYQLKTKFPNLEIPDLDNAIR
jgi:hypothetical protein